MRRLVALMLAVVTPLIACQPVPASFIECDGVPREVCAQAFQQVRTMFDQAGEVVQSATVSPTGRADCLHDEVPLADVVVRLERRPDPVLLTISRSAEGEPSLCF